MDYLPSKQFIIIVATALVVVVGGWLARSALTNFHVAPLNQKAASSSQASEELALRDSDNDGLPDWEEVIWHTDPHNPDTDGDSTPDGEEVKQHRDPAKAGPDDLLDTATDSSSQKAPSPAKPETLTEEFNNDFNVRYLTGVGLNGGEQISADQASQVSTALSQEIQKKVDAYQDVYTQNDIVVSLTKNPRDYANDLGVVLEKNNDTSDQTEIDIVKAATATKDMKQLDLLTQYITRYKNLISFLKQERVPSAYVAMHLDLLNTMNNLKIAAEQMQKLPTDPIATEVGLLLYQREIQRAPTFFKNLKTQLDKDNITLDDNDPGVFLNKYFEVVSPQ